MMPEKGDRVRVTFEGEYSHRGGKNALGNGSAGFHVVDVPGRLGRHTASAPPDATVEVLEKALPPEPPVGAMVTLNTGLPYCIYYRSEKGWVLLGTAGPYYTWRDLHETGPICRVYVDPLAGAAKLPTKVNIRNRYSVGATTFEVELRPGGEVAIGAALLGWAEARRLATAILAATGGLD